MAPRELLGERGDRIFLAPVGVNSALVPGHCLPTAVHMHRGPVCGSE